MKEATFLEWYKSKEEKYGSLVTPSSAAKMIGIKRQYLDKIIEFGRIEKLYFEDIPFIGIKDIEREIDRRKSKITLQNQKDTLLLKAITEELKEKINKIRERKTKDLGQDEKIKNEIEYIDILQGILHEEESSETITEYKI